MWDGQERLGAFIDFETGERLNWSCNPDVFSETDEAAYATQSIPGMSGPKYQFASGGERGLSFILRFHYAFEPDVAKAINTLRSWLYADYVKGRIVKGPHRILISYGNNWLNEKWIMASVEIVRKLHGKDGNCIAADVAVTLREYIETSRGREEVAG